MCVIISEKDQRQSTRWILWEEDDFSWSFEPPSKRYNNHRQSTLLSHTRWVIIHFNDRSTVAMATLAHPLYFAFSWWGIRWILFCEVAMFNAGWLCCHGDSSAWFLIILLTAMYNNRLGCYFYACCVLLIWVLNGLVWSLVSFQIRIHEVLHIPWKLLMVGFGAGLSFPSCCVCCLQVYNIVPL